MIRTSALLVIAGCNTVLGLDPTREIDAYHPDAPPGCSGSLFDATSDLSVMMVDSLADPTLLDAHELWFTWRHGSIQIASATRTDTTGPFSAPEAATFANNDNDTDPALTGDGLHLFFIAQDNHVYQVDRDSRESPWGAARLVQGIDGQDASQGIDVTPDGLAIYFCDGNYHLHTASRASLTASFDPVKDLAAKLEVTFPSISPDQLELFFNPHASHELHRLTRTDPTADFQPMTDTKIYADGDDPDISADATTLIYSNQGQLQTAHRDCP